MQTDSRKTGATEGSPKAQSGMPAHEMNRNHPVVSREDRIFSSFEEYALFLTHVKAYEEAARRWSGKRILDWGCNDGYGLEILRGTAGKVYGVDVSRECVDAARARLGPDVGLQTLDNDWAAPAGFAADCVTMFQVVEHVSDYDRLFASVGNVLAPGGCLWLSTPNAARRLCPGAPPWNRFHVREFRHTELSELLKRWFAIVQVEGLFGTQEIMEIDERRITTKRLLVGAMQRERTANLPLSLLKPFIRARTTKAECLSAFSTRDLWFAPDRLDEAIDLFACCLVA